MSNAGLLAHQIYAEYIWSSLAPKTVAFRLLEKVSPGNYSIVVYSEQESGRAKVLIQVQFLMLGI
jgi:hypothetical protein